jgi:hypothetical protein
MVDHILRLQVQPEHYWLQCIEPKEMGNAKKALLSKASRTVESTSLSAAVWLQILSFAAYFGLKTRGSS